MATIPTPRSYSQIVGDMLDAFLSRTGLPSVRVGSPHLSIIEAGAQSDLRSSQDIFNLLNSQDLDRATGQALDRIGADEDAPRIGESPASGLITITDTSFTKIESKIFQGLPPPIVGSATINVADALDFPASGEIYIGRGTGNYEGPLAYTSKVNNTNYWTLNLDAGSYTSRYHNLGESVVLAQGGNRTISAGTVVQTPQGNTGTAIGFSLLYTAILPDGETSIDSVTVVARLPGLIGNAIANSITAFSSPPFAGAVCTNPLPYSNGQATESDNTYRERIRAIRQSRSRGTPLALKTFVTGITSPDENKRVLSASVVTREGFPTTLYIDDGTGYEEQDIGISIESIIDSALGGEQYFQLVHGRPVAKAYAEATLTAPYNITPASVLSVLVGGVRSEHSFSADEFRAISAGSAYEVVASINGNEDLLFSARTTNAGTTFAVFAKSDTNEDVEVVEPSSGLTDANPTFGISAGRVDTVRLYKNDRLLSKDGQLATLNSNAQGLWAPVSSPVTLTIRIDGVDVATTPTNTYSITSADFINADTGYVTLSHTNSLESWAAVLNYKIPGITASVAGGVLVLTSNRGRSASASLEISACDLVTNGFFSIGTASGADRDYTFDRNLGQGRLEDSLILHEGDKLTAGSIATRAFLESGDLGSITLNAAGTTVAGEFGAELWFVVDGAAQIINTGIGAGTPIAISLTSSSFYNRVRLTGSTLFENVAVGDWMIATDAALNANNQGAWRIATIDPSGTWVEIERPTTWIEAESINLAEGGLIFVRSTADVQRVFVPAGSNYTALTLASSINGQLRGAAASVYQTNRFRVRTNSFLVGGDIALVTANAEGLKLTLPVSSAVENETTHLAAAVAGHPEVGTPNFDLDVTAAVASTTVFNANLGVANLYPGRLLVAGRNTGGRFGNPGHYSPIEVVSGTTITLRRPAIKEWLNVTPLWTASPYALTGEDELTVLLDGDTTSRRFVVPTFRRLTPGTSTYGLTNDFKDADNADLSLASAFGLGMDWRDFAVFMPARAKSHRIAGVDTNQTILWRYKRLGAEGNAARIQYIYPLAPNSTTLVSVDPLNSAYAEIGVRLPSGAARTGVVTSNSTKLGYGVTAGPTAGLYTYTYVLNLPIATASREVRLNFVTHNATLWQVGETVTGGTSLATGVIVAGSDLAPASGKLILNTVVGTFANGEVLTGGTSGATANASGSQYGVAKLVLTLPAGVTNHGFSVGNALHMEYNGTGTGAGFISSAPTVNVLEVPSGTAINYIEGTTAIAATAGVGTVSFDTAEATLNGSTVVGGDIFNIGTSTSLPAGFEVSMKIATSSTGYVQGYLPTLAAAVSGTLSWGAINATANLSWFPISGSGITAIAAAVNAQGNSSPVTAVAVGTGADTSGTILFASYEPSPFGLDGTDPWYYLTDGLNWIRSNTTPPSVAVDYNFTFKNAITASLALNSDWLNEDIRIVPITAENLVDYLNTSGPGGLFANGEISASTRATKPQIATLTVGSTGSVQVQGGTANSISAAVKGSSVQVATTYAVTTVATSDTVGMSAGHWMLLENSVPVSKVRIDSGTNLDSISTAGVVVFDGAGTKAWDFANTATMAPLPGLTWQFTKQGDFVIAIHLSGTTPDLTGVAEGDWVHISNQITPGATVSSRNQGLFRVVRADAALALFWFENPNVLEEESIADLAFLTYDSIVPGDKLVIGTTDWGTNNLGTWTVAGIDLTTYDSANTNSRWKFTLDTTNRTPTAVVAPGPAALGSNANLVRVMEGSASHLVKKIHGISVNPDDSTLTDIKFTTWSGAGKASEASGTLIKSLDKLHFGVDLASGIDGYRHSTGLIEEANKVEYGVESDPSTYPGVIAAGANVNIQGPLVHRVQVSMAIRRASVSAADIKDKVRSAVASVINSTGVGSPIAISDLITAAQGVNGVVSVTVLSPSFGPGDDLINIQPYEKPLVLSLDEDVLISFVGE